MGSRRFLPSDPVKTFTQLLQSQCRALEGGKAMPDAAVDEQLAVLPSWTRESGAITRSYSFANYWETIAFVNALAYIVHREDHHPELVVGYNRCKLSFDTHSVGGISENDFICAAKCDATYANRPRAPSAPSSTSPSNPA